MREAFEFGVGVGVGFVCVELIALGVCVVVIGAGVWVISKKGW
ncbi:MAG: hypothetical protein WCZ98_01460 [Sideroxydans sp.]